MARLDNIVSKNFILFGLATAACGALKGFYDAMDIPIPAYAIFGPVAVQGIMGALDGINISQGKEQITGNYPLIIENEIRSMSNNIGSSRLRKFYGGYMGFFGEAIGAGIEIGIGYGLGYWAGMKFKGH